MFDLKEHYMNTAIECTEEVYNATTLNYLTQEYLSAQRYLRNLYEEKIEEIVKAKECKHEDK